MRASTGRIPFVLAESLCSSQGKPSDVSEISVWEGLGSKVARSLYAEAAQAVNLEEPRYC